jgi:hypothetical protein
MAGANLKIRGYAGPRMLDVLSRHRCTACGACCRWPGQVFLYPADIRRIASKLKVSRKDFVTRWCTVIHWRWKNRDQFRIGLARKRVPDECVFLNGALCSIHEYKPLVCKAGPAAWSWINTPRFFWYYVRSSPSFGNGGGLFPIKDANRWFTTTRNAEVAASRVRSLGALATVCKVPKSVLRSISLIEFKEDPNVSKPRTTYGTYSSAGRETFQIEQAQTPRHRDEEKEA